MALGPIVVSGNDMFRNVPRRFLPPPQMAGDYHFSMPWMQGYLNRSFNAGFELAERPLVQGGGRDRVAIYETDTGAELTFGAISALSNRFANGLSSLGVGPGDRVLYRFGEVGVAAIVKIGILKAGGVAVPCSISDGPREVEYFLRDTEARLAVVQAEGLDAIRGALESSKSLKSVVVSPECGTGDYISFKTLVEAASDTLPAVTTEPLDAAGIYYTGGTTGQPKGIIWTHFNEVYHPTDVNLWFLRRITPWDVSLCHAPLGHAYGNVEKINYPLRSLTPAIYKERPTPQDCLRLLQKHRVTIFAGVPTMYAMMLDVAPASLADELRMRVLIVSGERLHEELSRRWSRFHGTALANSYGSCATQSTIISPVINGRTIAPPTSIGLPVPGVEVMLLNDDGEPIPANEPGMGRLAFRGPIGITYWCNAHPEMPGRMLQDRLPDGWNLADDNMERDADGWYYFRSRTDDMIVTAGHKVASADVEEALATHPAVEEVAVIGVPDEVRGQLITAFVKLRGAYQPGPAMVSELQDYAKAQMAKHKYPRSITFVDRLPKDKVGKIQRKLLRTGDFKPSQPNTNSRLGAKGI